MPQITITPHRGKPQTHEISDADVAAIKRWESAGCGRETPATTGWESLTDDQRDDAECAMAWRCHDVHHYEIAP